MLVMLTAAAGLLSLADFVEDLVATGQLDLMRLYAGILFGGFALFCFLKRRRTC